MWRIVATGREAGGGEDDGITAWWLDICISSDKPMREVGMGFFGRKGGGGLMRGEREQLAGSCVNGKLLEMEPSHCFLRGNLGFSHKLPARSDKIIQLAWLAGDRSPN